MIATFVIEIVAMVWTLWRYKLDNVTRLAALILFCLAVFQLAEFTICEGVFGLTNMTWARIGFVAITLLPPLGIHMATNIAGKKGVIKNSCMSALYVIALIFSLYFLTADRGFSEGVCAGNYVIFSISHTVTHLYAIYYYGLLAISVVASFVWASRAKNASTRVALRALAIGYLAFIVPTTAANIVAPETLAAIPSVMCGFAVILALILIGFVLPNYSRGLKKRAKKVH